MTHSLNPFCYEHVEPTHVNTACMCRWQLASTTAGFLWHFYKSSCTSLAQGQCRLLGQELADLALLLCAGTPVYALTDGTVCDPAKDSKCV